MDEQIVITLKPTEYKHILYIFSNKGEEVPIIWESTMDNLAGTLNKAIEDFDINSVRLTGPKAYASKIMKDLSHSVSTQFGLNRKVDFALI